jgi:hypothetical protein
MVFPYSVPAEGHEVVHTVVGLCHRGEDGGHALLLFGFGDGFEAEVSWAGGIAGWRLVAGWVVDWLVEGGGCGGEGAGYLGAGGGLEGPSKSG